MFIIWLSLSTVIFLLTNSFLHPKSFKVHLINEGYNPIYGARPLRRAVMRLLEDTLSEEFLSEKIKEGDTAVVDLDSEGKVTVLLGDKLELVGKN